MKREQRRSVWVREVGVLAESGKRIAYWEVWDSHNTREDAKAESQREFKQRPSWVTAKFHLATNRIRKYVPAVKGRK